MIPPSRTQLVGEKWIQGEKLLKFVIGFVFSVEIYISQEKKVVTSSPKGLKTTHSGFLICAPTCFYRILSRKQWLGCWTSMVLKFSPSTGEVVWRNLISPHNKFISGKRLSWRKPYWPRQWFQLRAILHQLLQREVAAAFHSADSQVRAGRVRDGGDWSKAYNLYLHSLLE